VILETTYSNKDNKQLIDNTIGKAYTFFEAFKMKGIGSKRLIIEDVSPNMMEYINTVQDINYANIEMRPNGILVHINKGLKNYTWIIPFYQLVIYKTNGSSIHAQGKFIRFKNNQTFKENKEFFKKLLNAKVEYDQTYNVLPY
jgi:hypothetical protein